jgi:hypothetical protein
MTHEHPPTHEDIRKAFGDGAAEGLIAGAINHAWPVLDAHASSELAREMIRARNVNGLIQGMPWQEFIAALGDVTVPLAAQVGRAVRDAARDVGPVAAKLTFLNTDAVSVKYAQTQGSKLIASITESQREAIRTVMATALEGQYTVDQAASLLRDSIGLHPAWAEAVAKYQTKAYTRMVKDGMAPARAAARSESMGLRYRNRLVKRRAQTIARTEIQTASNLGRYATWAQMIGSGVAGQASRKEWSPGPGACPVCSGLAGDTVAWDQPFSNGLIMPPAHPNCRCTAVLIPAVYANQALNPVTIDWLSPVLSGPDLASGADGVIETTAAADAYNYDTSTDEG